jgi:hypothetical protein
MPREESISSVIDPTASREFQGGGAHEAFRSRGHEKKG